MDRTILIIYTGGTIGSVQTAAGGLGPAGFFGNPSARA